MKSRFIISGLTLAAFLLGATAAHGQSLNPIHWIKKSPNASEELAANKDENKKLSAQLQAILPPRMSLNDACLAFKNLTDCVTALHVSHNLKVKFSCLKWDLTAVQPSGNVSACKRPEDGKAMNLVKAIHLLKPEADAKVEAKAAEKRAREDIKDATNS
jgi:hypothetical protein